MTAREQLFGEVRADEAGAAGDQEPHQDSAPRRLQLTAMNP